MSVEDIPEFVKHCTMAIFKKLKEADKLERFDRAFLIARGTLVRQGYLTEGSAEGDVDKIRLTAEGLKRDKIHRKEGYKGRVKTEEFRKLYWRSKYIIRER